MKRNSPLTLAYYWLPVILWCALIFYLSHVPYLRIVVGPWDFWIRKSAHLTEYAILARLLARAFVGTTRWSWKRIFVCALSLSLLYACTDEYHQTFVAGRVGSIRDVAVDTTGAWLGLGMVP